MNRYLQLFISFLKVGLFTFGGGYAMIPIIEKEVIDNRCWIERKEFLDLLTLAQSAPGPISLNTAVFVGYKLYGYRGALTALLGVVLPSFMIILTVATFFSQIRHNQIVDAAFKGIRPIVVALMFAPALGFARSISGVATAVAAAVALMIWYAGITPILLLLAGAIIGLLLAVRRGKEVKR